jgi:dCTP deaminase
MLLNDSQIAWLCASDSPIISPYSSNLVSSVNKKKIISYGQSSSGYDLRLSPTEFKIFHRIPGEIVDPKNFNSYNLYNAEKLSNDNGEYFVLPAHTYGLGVVIEKLQMPDNITGILLTKSTYARCGLINNPTLINPGWNGYLTIEIANLSDSDCKVYANEGIAIAIFLENENCNVTYSNRVNTYQNQPDQIVTSFSNNISTDKL